MREGGLVTGDFAERRARVVLGLEEGFVEVKRALQRLQRGHPFLALKVKLSHFEPESRGILHGGELLEFLQPAMTPPAQVELPSAETFHDVEVRKVGQRPDDGNEDDEPEPLTGPVVAEEINDAHRRENERQRSCQHPNQPAQNPEQLPPPERDGEWMGDAVRKVKGRSS